MAFFPRAPLCSLLLLSQSPAEETSISETEAPGDLAEGRIPKMQLSPAAFGPTCPASLPGLQRPQEFIPSLKELVCFLLLQGNGKHPGLSVRSPDRI